MKISNNFFGNKRLRESFIVTFCIFFVLSLLFLAGVFSNIQLRLSDSLYGGNKPLDSIVILAIDDASIQEIGRWPWQREKFAEVINYLNDSKLIGIDVAFLEKSENDSSFIDSVNANSKVILAAEFITFNQSDDEIFGDKILFPIAGNHGYVNMITDKDGITRSVNLELSKNTNPAEPCFSCTLYKKYWGEDTPKSQRFMINFASGDFKTYPISEVINGKIAREEFAKKIVLIGSTAQDLHDTFYVPISKGHAMPGVEVHANLLQTFITKDYLFNQSKFSVIFAMFLSAMSIFLITYYFDILKSGLFSLIILFGYVFFAIFMFDLGTIMNLIYVPLTILLVYFGKAISYYFFEKKEREKTKAAFEKYVSPVLVSEIMKDPTRLKLGGEKREITVFFSDIRGFTTLSESLTPEKLVHVLNEYLTQMTNVIMKNNGLVDKYIGDAIMAFWNAPLDEKNHAQLAVKTALEMIDELEKLNKKLAKENIQRLEIGIGINTGDAVVGNMGSLNRFDYTAMGDTINTASRLEGLNKLYGTKIIITRDTKHKIQGFVLRELDKVRVKGKKDFRTISEVICEEKKRTPAITKKITQYEKALFLYYEGKFKAAIPEFKKVNDCASILMLERCQYFIKNPPSDWKGVFEMKTK